MKRIIIDTNFLMVPCQFKVDIFSEIERICNFNYKLWVFGQTIAELENIAKKQAGREKRAALLALQLIKLKKISMIKSGQIRAEHKDVDSLILDNTDKNTIVATQDLELKRELLRRGTHVIILRQKKYLEIVP